MRIDSNPRDRAIAERRHVVLVGPVPNHPELYGLFFWGPSGRTLQDPSGLPSMTCHRDALEERGTPTQLLLEIGESVLENEDPGVSEAVVIVVSPIAKEN